MGQLAECPADFCVRTSGKELHEANKLGLEIGGQKLTTFQVLRPFSLDFVDGLTEVPETPPLADGSLIEDLRNPFHEAPVKGGTSDLDPLPEGLSNCLTCILGDLLLEPVIVRCQRDCGDVVPFEVIGELRIGFGQPLPEGEEVGPNSS